MTMQYNVTVQQGADYKQDFYPHDKDNVTIDLTGATARVHVRANVNSQTVLADLTTENGGLIIYLDPNPDPALEFVGAAWAFGFRISAALSSSWSFDKGVYDFEIVSSSGVVTRELAGTFVLDREITR